MTIITQHARQQCYDRGVDPAQVERAIAVVSGEIKEYQHLDEVKVVVERLEFKVYAPDGSNGDLIVAAVKPDPEPIVKTVMFMRRSQAKRRARREVYIGGL